MSFNLAWTAIGLELPFGLDSSSGLNPYQENVKEHAFFFLINLWDHEKHRTKSRSRTETRMRSQCNGRGRRGCYVTGRGYRGRDFFFR